MLRMGWIGWLALALVVTQGACGDIVAPPGEESDATGDTDKDATANRPPVISPVSPLDKQVEGVLIEIELQVSDPDDDKVTVTAAGLPNGATFDAAKRRFAWTPSASTAMYGEPTSVTVTFTAKDDGEPQQSDELQLQIVVYNDQDGDGIRDEDDDDLDGDGLTNAEELALGTKVEVDDTDGDNVKDGNDNCPLTKNQGQKDTDADGRGDDCDPCPLDGDDDADDDGHCGNVDNCPDVANADQKDDDSDGQGNACDPWPTDPNDDADDDGIPEPADNCPTVANAGQEDADEDGIGDACDSCPADPLNDQDKDLVCGDVDNCPEHNNPNQTDTDEDGIGDACDTCPNQPGTDLDGDGVCGDDNCPSVPNVDQKNSDGDLHGDVCDPCPFDPNDDADDDGVCGDVDVCPEVADAGQEDADEDGVGDACDACPLDPNNDEDADGVCGDVDNCPTEANADQADVDGDGLGDVCDPDIDGDGVLNGDDNCPADANPGQQDLDGDGKGDACDEDADGDGVLDAQDNCPGVANPTQVDVDGDGLGLACDGWVDIPKVMLPDSPFLDALGHAHGRTVALTLFGVNPCSAFPSACADPTLLVFEGGEYFTGLPAYLPFGPDGALGQPFVGPDEAAFFPARDGNGGFALDRVVGGELAEAFADEIYSIASFVAAPNGTTLAAVDYQGRALLSLDAAGGALEATGTALLDMAGKGPVRVGDTLYYPVQTSATSFALRAYQGTTTPTELFKGSVELRFMQLDAATGNPWYCVKPNASASLQLVMVNGKTTAKQRTFSGPSCAKISVAKMSPKGNWWLVYQGLQAGDTHRIERWDPVANTSLAVNGKEPITVHFAGEATYLEADCGTNCFSIRWYDPASGTLEVAVPSGLKTYYNRQIRTSVDGRLVVIGRDAAPGNLANLLALRVEGNKLSEDELGAFGNVFLQEAWFGPKGHLWARISNGGTVEMVSLHEGSGGPVSTLQFKTSGGGHVTYYGDRALVGVDGTDKGLYVAEVVDGLLTVDKLDVEAAAPHSHFLPTPDGSYAKIPWIRWPLSSGKWGLGRWVDGTLEVVADDLTGPPIHIHTQAGTGQPWFALQRAGGFDYVTLEDGELVTWQSGQFAVHPLFIGDSNLLWGLATQATAAADREVCKLPPAKECWKVPTTEGAFPLWGPFVTPEGNVFALLYDEGSGAAALWRNVASPE